MKKTTRNPEDPMTLAETEEGELLERLTERVERAVDSIQKLRRERDELRGRLAEVESALKTQGADAEELGVIRKEIEQYRGERDEIRNRINVLLESLSALDEE
jgi:FtsZ-binding cell division protein ZapB